MQTLAPSKQRGFTLMEAMVVVVIIGILAAMAYPSYLNYVRNARLQNAKTELALAQNMLEKYYAQNSSFRKTGVSPAAYPTEILTNIQGNNAFFNIAFYTQDEPSKPAACNPANASNDRYCLYAAPIQATNAGETRFIFADATGVIQECEKGTASITAVGVLTNKWNAVCSTR